MKVYIKGMFPLCCTYISLRLKKGNLIKFKSQREDELRMEMEWAFDGRSKYLTPSTTAGCPRVVAEFRSNGAM